MFDWGSLPWGDIISGAAKLGTSIYGANQAKSGAKQAAQMATPVPWSGTSMYGSAQFDPKTKSYSLTQASNPFAQLFNVGGMQSLANAFSAPGSAYSGAAPEIAAAANQMFGPAQDAAAADRLSVLRQIAAPEEQRGLNSLNDKLFQSGTLGTTGGGIRQEAYYKAMADADLKRSLASQDWAQQRSMDRFNTALQAVGAGQAGATNAFNMGVGSMGQIQNMFQMLLNQGNLGVGAGAGAPPGLSAAATTPVFNSAIAPFLQSSGAFDALGKWIGGQTQAPAARASTSGDASVPYLTSPDTNYTIQPYVPDFSNIQAPKQGF